MNGCKCNEMNVMQCNECLNSLNNVYFELTNISQTMLSAPLCFFSSLFVMWIGVHGGRFSTAENNMIRVTTTDNTHDYYVRGQCVQFVNSVQCKKKK